MDSQLYIPKKIKVGYQKRSDTYNGNLAYIIYYDDKGVLRKEKSWEGWRDKAIEPQEFDNTPIDGFVINKSLKRYNWSHFSTNRTMIRLFDSRGFEFEITPENLIGILMNGDCLRRGFEGKFVYAWSGTELVLLPANSEEYEKATVYTKLQAGKVGARDLVPGCVYRTKKQEDLIYLGKMDWFEKSYKKGPNPVSEAQYKANLNRSGYGGYSSYYQQYESIVDIEVREAKKQYIFISVKDEKTFTHVAGLAFLANKITDNPVQNFAELMEKFETNVHSRAIKGVSVVRAEGAHWQPNFDKEHKAPYYGRVLEYHEKTYYVEVKPGKFAQASLTERYNVKPEDGRLWEWSLSNDIQFNPETGMFDDVREYSEDGRYLKARTEKKQYVTREEIEQNTMNFGILMADLTNGKQAEVRGNYYI